MTATGAGAGNVAGTPGYMSPEQVRGKPVDRRADIWAFGCVLYEMLTGRRAFRGETVTDTMVAILDRDPDWSALAAGTSSSAVRVIQLCLAKDVRHRLREIADAALLLEGQDRPSVVERPPARAPHPWLLAGIVAGVIVGAVVAVLLVRRRDVQLGEPMAKVIATQLTDYGGTESAGALAPDGRSFVFVSSHGGTTNLWVRQIAGGDPVRLTNDAANEDDPAYSPDGQSVYYTRSDGNGVSIWQIGALGGQPRKVIANARSPAPAPDRQSIAFYQPQSDGTYDLQVSRLDGSQRRTVADRVLGIVGATEPTWSPDGARIAYSRGGLFAPSNLFVVQVADGRDRQVTHFDRSAQGVQWQTWLPDGHHVLVWYTPAPQAAAAADLSIVDVRDGSVSRLTTSLSTTLLRPSVSADGHRVIATSTMSNDPSGKCPSAPILRRTDAAPCRFCRRCKIHCGLT